MAKKTVTFLDSGTGRAALPAGAQFLVSPTLNINLIHLAHRYSAGVIPGAMSPVEYLKAFKGPLPQILLVPTGGVNLQNAGAFIKAGAAAPRAGGELVDKKVVKEEKLHVITENTRAFLKTIHEAREAKF